MRILNPWGRVAALALAVWGGHAIAGGLPDFSGILHLSQNTPYVLLADLEERRLYVVERTPDGPRVVVDTAISIGAAGVPKMFQGDLRTPMGVYTIQGFLAGESLGPAYGAGAFVLDYPNHWDRFSGRTGAGIWMHGIGAKSGPPLVPTRGCVAIGNAWVGRLARYIEIGETPIVLGNAATWGAGTADVLDASLRAAVRLWGYAWQLEDRHAYRAAYSPLAPRVRAAALAGFERASEAGAWTAPGLDDIDLFAYPGEPDLVMARFQWRARTVVQYWRKEHGVWQIVQEDGLPSRGEPALLAAAEEH